MEGFQRTMSGLPPAYDEVAGSSAGGPPPPAIHSDEKHPSAKAEKQALTQHLEAGAKTLKIWHAASGNSLITAADEKTPIYNIIDSRAPDEAEQKQQFLEAQKRFEAHGMTRQDPTQQQHGDIQFAHEIANQRANPSMAQPPKATPVWALRVRRGGDRNGPVLATIKRHYNAASAVGIELEGQKSGIEQHSGFPHTKYDFKWQGRSFTWTKTHKAPGTSRLDSGNFVCRDDQKTLYAYSTSEDDRCDGSLQFEDRAVTEGLLDIMTITGFIMRDLDSERRNPSYMRYGAGSAYGYGYGPYGSPYAANYGFMPYGFGLGLGFPLLL